MAKKTIKKAKIIARDYVNFLEKDGLPIKQALLFGSYAKGKQHKDSDIDICIISPKFKDHFKAIQYLLRQRRSSDVDMGIEPVGYSPQDFAEDENPFVWEIKKTGIRIL